MSRLIGPAPRFLTAALLSALGDWMTTTALVVVLYGITGSSAGPAAYILFRVAPRALGPTLGGWLSDRWSARNVIVVSSLGQAVLVVALMAAAGTRQMPLIFSVVAANQVLGAVTRPALPALVPSVTRPDRLGSVNAALSTLQAGALFVGPAIGAVLLQPIGYRALLLINAGGFVIAAGIMATLPRAEPAQPTPGQKLQSATATLWRTPVFRRLGAAFMASAAAVTATQAVLVVAAAEKFGGANTVGWLYAAVGIGGVTVSIYFLKRPPVGATTRGVVVASVIELVPLLLLIVAPNLTVALVLLVLSTGGGTAYQVRGFTALQREVPPHLLGRANGGIWFVGYVGMLVGAVEALILAPLVGWRAALFAMVAAGLFLIALSAVLPVAGKELEEDHAVPSAT